ncbi:MAG TPA: flagellar motor switch protein FliG, partial [Symbiobacteriaceae bacterium]|nr:flagellar motor switch protein FliG [Symbiobacteriaceae bacterium]
MEAVAALTGRQKAAIFCINVGSEQSAKLLKYLRDDEIELLTVEIAQAKKVTGDDRDGVLQEFVELTTAERYIRTGGIDYARELLEKALGERRAKEILARLTASLRKRPFDSVKRTDPTQLAGFLQNEHPQTIAVVMAHLSPEQAAVVL